MLRSTPCPPKWKSDDLYKFLIDAFPEHLTPFNRLDVNRLAGDIGKSYESLYQKLRKGRLNVEWAKLLCEFSNDEQRLCESAERYAREMVKASVEYQEAGSQEQGGMEVRDCQAAVLAVRKRFAEGREPLTLEQDFMRFFI